MALRVLVRGSGDVGSAVAHALFTAACQVALHDDPEPAAARRLMAYSDAMFDGRAELEGVAAWRCLSEDLAEALRLQAFIPVTAAPFEVVLAAMPWDVLVDARMRKRSIPEDQTALAPLAIGLGPNFVAGGNVHLAVETSYEDLGRVVRDGPTLPLRGEPRPIAGKGRERYVYAPVAGRFQALLDIRAPVLAGQPVARLADMTLNAPIDGAIRGLARSGVTVQAGAKIIEIDPRGPAAVTGGIGERPRRIAQAVVEAIASAHAVVLGKLT